MYFLHLVTSYDMQEERLGLFHFPGPTGGKLGRRKASWKESLVCFEKHGKMPGVSFLNPGHLPTGPLPTQPSAHRTSAHRDICPQQILWGGHLPTIINFTWYKHKFSVSKFSILKEPII